MNRRSARRGRIRRCSSSLTQDEAAYLKRGRGSGAFPWRDLQRVGGCDRAGVKPEGQRRRSPWSLCRRPWSLMYFTANGRALPCCIAPFSQHGYENYTLGDAGRQSLAGHLERARVSRFSCGAAFGQAAEELRQLRPALEPVNATWPSSRQSFPASTRKRRSARS